MRKIVNLVALVGAASTAIAPLAAQPAPLAPQVEQALAALPRPITVAGRDYPQLSIEQLMREHNVPAVSIAIVREGRIVWTGAYGMADPATGRAVTPDTLFQAASISKPVAATAALDLVEQGRLALDRPVNEQLTSWRVPDSEAAAGEPVTLRRLLTHTAGLTVSGFPGYSADSALPTVGQILDGAAPANTDPVRVDIRPGAQWRYSGGGITVAQLLMTDVTGEPFPALMDRLVLRPVGMTRSTYAQPLPRERVAEAALAHRPDGEPIAGHFHAYPEMAAAGLWTTPSDLARWAIALSASFNGAQGGVLEPETARAMLTSGMGDWGLGLSVVGEGDDLRFIHGGSNEGYRAQLVFFPRRGDGMVIMTNGDNGGRLITALSLAFGRMFGWPGPQPRTITPVTISADEREAILGRYAADDFSVLVALQDDRIVVTPSQGSPFEIIPQAEDVYVSPDVAPRLQFIRDAQGRVTAVTGGGRTMTRSR